MKKYFVSLRLFMCFALVWLVMFHKASAEVDQALSPLTIVTEDWPPLNYSEDGEIKGFASEVLRLVMKELNVNYKIVALPGNRGLKILKKGPRVLFYSFIRTPERESMYKWIGPFGNQTVYFYKYKGSKLKINTLDDAKKVGGVCCRSTGLVFDYLKRSGFRNLDVGVNPASIYLKVIHGRCDLAIGEPAGGVAFWLKKLNFPEDSLEKTSLKVMESSLYIAASKDISDDEIQRWQRALEKVKATSEYAKLYHAFQELSK